MKRVHQPLLLAVCLLLTMGSWQGCTEFLPDGKLSSEDSAPRVDSLEEKIDLIKSIDPSDAIILARQGLQSAEKKKLPNYQMRFWELIGALHYNEGQIDASIKDFNNAIYIARNQADTLAQSKILSRRGYAYLEIQDSDLAMEDISQAILLLYELKGIHEQKRNKQLLNSYLTLVTLYGDRAEFAQAYRYLDSCKNLLRSYPDSLNTAKYLYEMGLLQLREGQEKETKEPLIAAISSYREGASYYRKLGHEYLANSSYLYLSSAYDIWLDLVLDENGEELDDEAQSLRDSSYFLLTKHTNWIKEINSLQNYTSGLQRLSKMNGELENYELAREQLHESIKIAQELNSPRDIAYGYLGLAELYEELGMADSVGKYFREFNYAKEDEQRQEIAEDLRVREAGFEAQLKELENQRQLAESKRRFQGTLSSSIVIALVLIAVAIYYYQSNKTKKKLMSQQAKINQQLVIDLMKEQTIESLNARLEGQEKERKRVAKELHDTLGGTLAAVKLSMQGLKKKLDEKALERFEYTQELLQNAYQETRQLSHDMMALPLKHLGLEPSIDALCKTINMSGKIEVSQRKSIHLPLNFSDDQQTHLYRIVQELLQNVIKHSGADKVELTMISTGEGFKLKVQDNGRGFPKNKPKAKEGMGLSNIRDRVQGLRGELTIQSAEGKGSVVSVFIPSGQD